MVGGLEASKGLAGCREPKGGRVRSKKTLWGGGRDGFCLLPRKDPCGSWERAEGTEGRAEDSVGVK